MGVGVAGLTENKANSANPAELELVFSWAELGNMMFQLVVWSMARNCISGCIINTVYSPGTIQVKLLPNSAQLNPSSSSAGLAELALFSVNPATPTLIPKAIAFICWPLA